MKHYSCVLISFFIRIKGEMESRRIFKSMDIIPIYTTQPSVEQSTRNKDNVRVSKIINKNKKKSNTNNVSKHTRGRPKGSKNISKPDVTVSTKRKSPTKGKIKINKKQQHDEEEETIISEDPMDCTTINFDSPSSLTPPPLMISRPVADGEITALSDAHVDNIEDNEIEEFLDFNKVQTPKTSNRGSSFINGDSDMKLHSELTSFGTSIEKFMQKMTKLEREITQDHRKALQRVNIHYKALRELQQGQINSLISSLKKHLNK